MTPEPPVGSRAPVLGLAARPGQRRAVRATGVALVVLALALGVRDATREEAAPAGEVRQEAPHPPAQEDSEHRGPAPAGTERHGGQGVGR